MPTSFFLLGHTHSAATVSWGLRVVLTLGPRSPKWHSPLWAQIFFSPSRSPQSLSSRPLARAWLYFPAFTSLSGILYCHRFCITVITHSTSRPVSSPALLLRSVHFLQHHVSAPPPHILNCSKGKDSLPPFTGVGWRIHIARNVVCGPPMEESKGSALLVKSKNIVKMKIAVNVSRYLLETCCRPITVCGTAVSRNLILKNPGQGTQVSFTVVWTPRFWLLPHNYCPSECPYWHLPLA